MPLYAQMKDYILAHIQSGEWPVGARVPSEHELVAKFKVSRMTANRTLRELADAGLVRRVAGSGSFVASRPKPASSFAFCNIADVIAENGNIYSQQNKAVIQITATPVLADAFASPKGLPLCNLNIIHFENQKPIQSEEVFVRIESLPDFAAQNFNTTTPDTYLQTALKPEEIEQTIEATMPDAIIQRALNIRSTEPCLALRCRYWHHGIIVAITTLISPASGYPLRSRIKLGDSN